MGDIKNVKKAYNTADWENREDYYIAEVSAIVLPADPDTKGIMKINSQIDSLLSEALMDFAFIKRKKEDYESKMKLAERECFNIVKRANATVKLTESETKGLVVEYLKQNPLQGMKKNVYELYQAYFDRFTFMENIIKILSEKKGAIVTDNAMMKIEAGM